LVNELKRECLVPVDVDDFAKKIAFDVIGSFVYGKSLDTVQGDPFGKKYIDGVNKILAYYQMTSFQIHKMILKPWYIVDFIKLLNTHRKIERQIVMDRVKSNSQDYKDILQQIINSRKEHVDYEYVSKIANELNLILVAGYETTAHTISFIMYLLAKHQKYQDKLLDVIKESGAIEDGRITNPECLMQLPLLNAIIHETQRLYPVAIGTSRVIERELKSGEIIIPANTFVNLLLLNMQYDPTIFPNPTEFQPERFLERMHPTGFYPFGGGNRTCLGQNMAKAEMVAVIAILVYNFKWKLKPGFEISFINEFTQKPAAGVWCICTPR